MHKELVIMVGIPCSGKSSYIKKYFPNYKIISFDDKVTKIAECGKLSYVEAYSSIEQQTFIDLMWYEFLWAIENNENIVLDDTFTKRSSREFWLKQAPKHYIKSAIVLHIDNETYQKRKSLRPEKVIPDGAIVRMLLEYEKPTIAEGFDEIKKVKNYESSR